MFTLVLLTIFVLCQVLSASWQNSQWKMHLQTSLPLYITISHQCTLSWVTYRPVLSGEHSFTQARQLYAFLWKKYYPTKAFGDSFLAFTNHTCQIYFTTTPDWTSDLKNKRKRERDQCGQTGTSKIQTEKCRALNSKWGLKMEQGRSEQGGSKTNERSRESGWEETPTVTWRNEKPAERDV